VPVPPTSETPLLQKADTGERRFEMRPGNIVAIENPSPRQVWTLSAFALPETLDRISLFKLTPDTVAEALASGYELEQITSFLEAETKAALDPSFVAEFARWTGDLHRIQYRRTLSLTADGAGSLDAAKTRLALAGFAVEVIADTLLVELPAGSGANAERAILQLLREAGFAPQAAQAQLGRQRER
jgi:hypothetical protein